LRVRNWANHQKDVLDWPWPWLSDLGDVRLLIGKMNRTDSLKLLRDYAEHGDEAAFRKLVEQYVNLVFSVATRRVGGDASLAQDVTQTVFTDLARKASSLRGVGFLGGWLHRHTGFVASTMLRSEQRRQVREQEAAQMNATQDSPDSLWQTLAPMLDDTIESLEPDDRQAVLLRFFERQDFRSIGAALGISDDAAQKRVSRALDKLRTLLAERGVTLTVMLLSSLLAGRAIMAAPAGLAGNVARLALAGAGAGGGLGLALLELSKSLSFKLALVGTVAVVALVLHLESRTVAPPRPARQHSEPSPTLATAMTTSLPVTDIPIAPLAPETTSVVTTNGVLLLNIVTADSGKPIPDVELGYTTWENGKAIQTKPLESTRFGVCEAPVPKDVSELQLVSQKDGFATTRLDWRPDRGETIPSSYTLQLARAVTIGGEVVGPDGNPVAGATVHFEPRPPSPQARPQSDDFPWNFDTTSDAQGHWQIDRIGNDAFKSLRGFSTHPEFVLSSPVNLGNDSEATTQLLAGTYVFHLRHAIVVSGTVVRPDGWPVTDADVLVGRAPGELGARKTKTRSDGTFSVAGCQPGNNLMGVCT
jgi:RNA polymerase sigma factor (sigma-70 family)